MPGAAAIVSSGRRVENGSPARLAAPIRGSRLLFAQLCFIAAGFLRLIFRRRTDPDSRRVVILEPYGMGDIVTLLPLISVIAGEGLQTTIVARAEWRDLVTIPGVSWLDARLPWTSYASTDKYRLSRIGEFLGAPFWTEFRRCAPGAVGIDPRGDPRSIVMLGAAGCDRVLTLDRYIGTDLRVPGFFGERVRTDSGARRWELAMQFAKLLGCSNSKVGAPSLTRPAPRTKRTGAPTQIAFLPAAPWKGKLWPTSRWKELAHRVTARGCAVTMLCGPGQIEMTRKQAPEVPVEEITSVKQWMDRLIDFDAVVTVDSGPMHVADALGIPLVALFGVTPLPLWAPAHSSSITVHHQNDEDFRVVQQVDENLAISEQFMDRISVDEVMNALASVIDRHGTDRNTRGDI
jgi:ADP-heptose:LPS heptosyltransferase